MRAPHAQAAASRSRRDHEHRGLDRIPSPTRRDPTRSLDGHLYPDHRVRRPSVLQVLRTPDCSRRLMGANLLRDRREAATGVWIRF